MKCKGKLFTQDNEVVRTVTHDCIPDEAQMDVKKAVFQAKKRTREEDCSCIPEIYSQEFNHLYNQGYELVTKIPQFDNVKNTMYRIRSRQHGVEEEPKASSDIVLDEQILKMSDGESFLLSDCGSKNRILIFASALAKKALREKTNFFVDGTYFQKCEQPVLPVIHYTCWLRKYRT